MGRYPLVIARPTFVGDSGGEGPGRIFRVKANPSLPHSRVVLR